MTRAECVRNVLAEFQARRARDAAELDARVAEAERLDPEIARLREENRALAFDSVKRIMALGDGIRIAGPGPVVERMKREIQRLNEQYLS